MLKLFPDTRFSYGNLMIQQYIHNKYFLETMCMTECGFNTICNRIGNIKVTAFKDIVTPLFVSENSNLDAKASLIHQLTGLLCKMIHHVEQKKCKASWVNALFFALMNKHKRRKGVGNTKSISDFTFTAKDLLTGDNTKIKVIQKKVLVVTRKWTFL